MKILYIDVQNTVCRMQDRDREIDRELLYIYVTKRYGIQKVIYAVGYIPSLQVEYDGIEQLGYTLLFKETIVKDGKTKGNVDIDVAIESIFDLKEGRLTTAYLMTNDGDYNSLIKVFLKYNVWGKLFMPDMYRASKTLKLLVPKSVDMQSIKHEIIKKPPKGRIFKLHNSPLKWFE